MFILSYFNVRYQWKSQFFLRVEVHRSTDSILSEQRHFDHKDWLSSNITRGQPVPLLDAKKRWHVHHSGLCETLFTVTPVIAFYWSKFEQGKRWVCIAGPTVTSRGLTVHGVCGDTVFTSVSAVQLNALSLNKNKVVSIDCEFLPRRSKLTHLKHW